MKVIITESGGVGIVSGKNVNIEVTKPDGEAEKSVSREIEEKDLKEIDKIKKEALKEIEKELVI